MLPAKVIVAVLTGIAGVALTTSLGNWQTRRGDEKAARQAQWDDALARAPGTVASSENAAAVARQLPQRVQAHGTFVPEATVYIDNRLVNGVAGFQVITPLAVADGMPWVLVNRGWAPRNMADREEVPKAPVSSGPVQVEGVAVAHVPRVLELGALGGSLRGIWQNLDFDAYEQASGRKVARFVVQQTNDTGDGLRRVWQRPDAGVDKHRGYAFQWYSLAALIAALTIYFGGKALRSDTGRA
ncbi:MAG: SURF1 family protein [Burkholderiaceae bacterium]